MRAQVVILLFALVLTATSSNNSPEDSKVIPDDVALKELLGTDVQDIGPLTTSKISINLKGDEGGP
ncbi:hypothetical protein EXN66_Car001146 [Channa argus]|uniref:Uncharacterized protein n=1 Tax=Channa argus TaxID=215402 RepID=A0A6G1R057_CHAAH|nr:hypothetical protein EXN66_Car001146 [Channa argus]